jgi:hexosaminidase
MKARGITDPARLEDVFLERVIDIAARYGKKAGVWNEAVSAAALDKSTIVYGWENIAAARRAAAAGYTTVFCAGEYFYFDMKQAPDAVGHIWAGIVPLEKVYSFSPAAVGFTEAEARNVVGIEATLFTELMLENVERGLDYLDYQFFPRVCALAEVGWTPVAERSWDDFKKRLGYEYGAWTFDELSHFNRLDAMGIKFYEAPVVGEVNQYSHPAATLTSSFKAGSKTALADVAAYKKAARFSRAPIEGDWFLWRFAEPLKASRIDLKTGYDHLQRAGFPQGRVEVSYDGRTFEPVAALGDLRASVSLDPARPIRALRVVCTSHGNGENFTIIQPLKIN